MKTAEETLLDIFDSDGSGRELFTLQDMIVLNSDLNMIKKAMKEYARQACEEQRENCFFSAYNAKSPSGSQKVGIRLYYQDMSQKEFRDTIINAPQPELK